MLEEILATAQQLGHTGTQLDVPNLKRGLWLHAGRLETQGDLQHICRLTQMNLIVSEELLQHKIPPFEVLGQVA